MWLLSALARTAAQPSRAQLRRHSAAVMPGTLAPGTHTHDPFQLTHADLKNMVGDIHAELDTEIRQDSELREMAKYYFDGKGKAIRPVIALCLGHAFRGIAAPPRPFLSQGPRHAAWVCAEHCAANPRARHRPPRPPSRRIRRGTYPA